MVMLFGLKLRGGAVHSGFALCMDLKDNLYVSGSFSDAIILDTITLTSYTLGNAFLIKYDTTGNILWLKQSDLVASNICSDTIGNIYIVGHHTGTLTIDSITLTSNGNADVFAAKYDQSGNLIWVRSFGGDYTDYVNGISSDNNGNIYLTGEFRSSSINFGNDTLINSITDSSTSDIFIVKYDTEGNEIWAKSLGGTNYDKGYDIKNDKNNNVYVTGQFFGHLISFDGVTLQGDGCNNTLLLKYSPTGSLIWAKGNHNSNNNKGIALCIDSINNVYVGGDFADILTVGDYQLVSTDDDGVNIYIVKYDSIGNVVNAISAGGDSFDITTSMSIDNNGKVYITGRTEGSYITFGNNLITQAESQSPDIFIAKLSECNFITPIIDKISNTLLQSSPADSYQWYFNGTIIIGATSQTYTATENGYYSVAVSDLSGCSASSDRMVVLGVGINEVNSSDLFFVYPNPVNSILNISGDKIPARITLCNTLGQTVAEFSNTNQINVGALANGIYVLQLYDKKGELLKTEKVIKQ
jgi:hypothetical protein